MGKFDHLPKQQARFISEQHIFFVATAPNEGKINLSPKGIDSFRVLNENQVAWLNLTGSGNETSAHVQENGRMTVMFCSFTKHPNILRLYGMAKVFHPRDEEWNELYAKFQEDNGARNIFVLDIDMVQTSCGYAVPFMEFVSERDQLNKWAGDQGKEGVQRYWEEKNTVSLDGKPIAL
jgi:hypothetical protein